MVLRTAFFTLLVAFFWVGCSTHTVHKEQIFLKTSPSNPFENRIYIADDNSTFYFDSDQFFIYNNRELPPLLQGEVIVNKDEIFFLTAKTQERFRSLISENEVILQNSTKILHLQKENNITVRRPNSLFEAARFGTIGEFKKLFEQAHASYALENSFGNTLLMEASFSGNHSIVKYLLQHNVDINRQNPSGFTALSYALKANNSETVRALLDAHASLEYISCEELGSFILQHDTYMPLFVSHGYDINCDNSRLLFETIELPIDPTLKEVKIDLLVNFGINIDAVSSTMGDVPLMRAASLGDAPTLNYLIDLGANIFYTDSFGRTTLDYDSIYLTNVNPEIKRILNKAGLYSGKKAYIDRLYDEANDLLLNGFYEKAYTRFKRLVTQYKQKRFFQGQIDAAMHLSKPTFALLNEVVEIYTYLYNEKESEYLETLVKLYEKMVPLASKDRSKTKAGFHPRSKYALFEKIEQLYKKEQDHLSIDQWYARMKNIKRMQAFSPLVKKELKNRSGIRYFGECLGDISLGKGTLYYKNGDTYYGDVINFIRHGKGQYRSKNGLMYDGYFKADKRHGEGLFTNNDGAMFLGEFKEDRLVSKPIMVRPAK